MRFLKYLIFAAFLLSSLASAQESPPLDFQAWKQKQVLDAQNNMLRISARISQLKKGKATKNESKQLDLTSSRLKKADGDPFDQAEKDLRRAQDSLEAANNWELEDYVNVYLPTLRTQPEAMQKLTERLTKEELADILKILLSRGPRSDAKQNQALLGGLAAPLTTETR